MQIRRLFYARLGALGQQRQRLLQQVPLRPMEAASEASGTSRGLTSISHTAQQLQENTDAELRAYLHVSAFLRLSTEGSQGRGVRRNPAMSLTEWHAPSQLCCFAWLLAGPRLSHRYVPGQST